MSLLQPDKARVRAAARTARAAAHAAGVGAAERAAVHALAAIGRLGASLGTPIGAAAGYLPIHDEIDPRPAMLALGELGYRLAVPVVEAPGRPLKFRPWSPGAATEPGAFGVAVPREGAPVEPDVLLVPLLAFDARGHRLGYGGGFYDRTIGALRSRGAVVALGLAYAGQQVPLLPAGDTDMRLDAIATEAGVIWPA